MDNAFATSSQPQSRNAMGSGLAQGSADLVRLRKMWQDQYSQGETQLQFREWLQEQGISNPTMPR